MTTDTATYRRDLILALRTHNVAPDRIGEIVAEVESHVADTSEDPFTAFGPPREYATRIAPPSGRFRATGWPLVLSSGVCGFLIAISVLKMLDEEARGLPGVPAWVAPVVAVLLWVYGGAVLMRHHRRVQDPRTGTWLTPSPRWLPVTTGACLLAVAAAIWLVDLLIA